MSDWPKTMTMKEVMAKFNSPDAVQMSAWADGRHRTAYQNVKRVIVNHASEKNEPEILIVTNKWIFRYTWNGEDFREERYEIDQFVTEFGQDVFKEMDQKGDDKINGSDTGQS